VNLICAHCGCGFVAVKRTRIARKFCSRSCCGLHYRGTKRPRTLISKQCDSCQRVYQIKRSKVITSRYCSVSCKITGHKSKPKISRSVRIEKKKGRCRVCGSHGISRKTKYCSLECRYLGRYKKSRDELSLVVRGCGVCGSPIRVWTKRPQKNCAKCSHILRRGSGNPNWKGGVTSEGQLIRRSPEGIAWRKSVFERDRFTCQICGKVGGTLHADHIKPFAYYPDLRTDIGNGRTLCEPCHKKTDTYLSGAKKHNRVSR